MVLVCRTVWMLFIFLSIQGFLSNDRGHKGDEEWEIYLCSFLLI